MFFMYANFHSYKDNLNNKNCTSSVLSYNSMSRPLPNNDEYVKLYVKYMPYDEQRKRIIDFAELNGVVDALELLMPYNLMFLKLMK